VENIRVNGLALQLQHGVYSEFILLWWRCRVQVTDSAHRALTNKHKESGLSVYINGDGSDVYEDKVFQIATAKTGSFEPTLILVGIRLGIDRITPVYWEALKASLQMSQSVGIAG
jgi:hypothetical protein